MIKLPGILPTLIQMLLFGGSPAALFRAMGEVALVVCMTFLTPLGLTSVKCFRCGGSASVCHGHCSGGPLPDASLPALRFT